jgi:enoyl-CoA hydratase/carnithine racemase
MHTGVAALLTAATLGVGGGAQQTATGYSSAVTRICSGAVLFAGRHRIGTRVGAVAVSRDIRATGAQRLRRVDAVPKPDKTAAVAARWIATERRLVATYARAYLQVWYAIERANTPAQRAKLPSVLDALVHTPDALEATAKQLEQRLHVPDCTGGIPPPSETQPHGL